MDTGVFGGSNSVPERPRWLIWTVCPYYIYGECGKKRIVKRKRRIVKNREYKAPRDVGAD